MVREDVKGAPVGQRSHERVVLPLIEERAGFLAGVWPGLVHNVSLAHLQRIGHGPHDRFDHQRQSLMPSHAGVVAEQDAVRRERLFDSHQHVTAHGFEPGRQELGNHVIAIPINDERRKTITLAVDNPVRGGRGHKMGSAPQRLRGGGAPERGIDRRVVAREQPQPDLRLRAP